MEAVDFKWREDSVSLLVVPPKDCCDSGETVERTLGVADIAGLEALGSGRVEFESSVFGVFCAC